MSDHRIVFLPWADFIWLEEKGKSSYKPDEWLGMIPDIVNSLARQLNFTYSIALSRDGQWGSVNKDGDWSGIIRDIIDGEADIAAALLAVTKTRSEVIDFMLPFYPDNFGFFINTQSAYAWTTYFQPFLFVLSNTLIVMCITMEAV